MSRIGRTAEVRLSVPLPLNPNRTDFTAVLANSRLVGLMESAAAKLVKPWLHPRESTISVKLDVTYLRPLPREAMVRAVATYDGGSGRLHHFTIHAFDDSGLIASCEHTRAVVSPSRLLGVAPQRAGSTSILLDA